MAEGSWTCLCTLQGSFRRQQRVLSTLVPKIQIGMSFLCANAQLAAMAASSGGLKPSSTL